MGRHGLYCTGSLRLTCLGITLSQAQLEVARKRAHDAGHRPFKFELIDFATSRGSFDRIVSTACSSIRLAITTSFSPRSATCSSPTELMLLHTIGRLGSSSGAPTPFTTNTFPGYHLPSLAQVSAASAKTRLIASESRSCGGTMLHVAHWLAGVTKAGQKSRRCTTRDSSAWECYLAGESLVRVRIRLQLSDPICPRRNALPLTRDYIAEPRSDIARGGKKRPAFPAGLPLIARYALNLGARWARICWRICDPLRD